MKSEAISQLSYLRDNISELALTCQPRWHPLGFVSCVIREQEKEFTTRLHYWPKFERRTKNPEWPIHSHAYDLSSYILEGRVRDMQYRLRSGADYTVYTVSYAGDNSVISASNQRVSVEKVIDEVRQAGEEYSVSIGSFHQTEVFLDETAISLVVLSNFCDVNPVVLGSAGKESYPYDRVEFDKIAFWDRIDGVIRAS